MLLGLERGESVGADTYAAVAEALGWSLDRIYSILAGEPVTESTAPSAALADVSDEEITAEVLRRMKRGEHGGDTAAIEQAPVSGETPAATRLPRRRPEIGEFQKKAARKDPPR